MCVSIPNAEGELQPQCLCPDGYTEQPDGDCAPPSDSDGDTDDALDVAGGGHTMTLVRAFSLMCARVKMRGGPLPGLVVRRCGMDEGALRFRRWLSEWRRVRRREERARTCDQDRLQVRCCPALCTLT